MALSLPVTTGAVGYDYGVSYSGLYTDNLSRTPVDPDTEFVSITRALLALREQSERLDASIFTQLEHRAYSSRLFDNEVLFGLHSNATWILSPRRFTFTVRDEYTQVPIDPQLALTPTNRQDANVFSAGPDLIFHLGQVDNLELGARYNNYYYEASPTDNQSGSGYARLVHLLSPLTRLSLNYEPSVVDYQDDELNQDFRRQDVFLGASTRALGSDWTAAGGRTLITRDDTPDLEGDLVRVSWLRQTNRETRFTVSASREYSESGRHALIIDPLLEGPAPVPSNPAEFVGGGIFLGRLVDAGYVHTREYGDDVLHLFQRKLDYESALVPLDQEMHGVVADFGYDYSGAWTHGVFANYAKTEYLQAPRVDKDAGAGFRVVHRFARNVSLNFEGRWSKRESTLFGHNYDELRAVITLAYYTNPRTYASNPFAGINNPLFR